MDDIDDSDVPTSGAVFTYGLSRFGDNEPGKFWVRNDKVVQVACGEEHTILITESGRAFSFGKNEWGQLGIGNDLTMHCKPTCVKSLKAAGEKVRLVACGRNHTLLVTESGSLYGMGNNVEKQISSGTKDTVSDPFLIHSGQDFMALAAGGEMSAALLASGQVLTWGSNAEGQCGIGDDDAGLDPVAEPTRVSFPGRVVSLSCGYYHAAAVLDDGRLFAWGESEGGKLGLVNVITSQLEPQEVPMLEPMRTVSCGNNHTVAVAASGRLYVWGEGPAGQLGLGEERETAFEPTPVDFEAPDVRIASAVAGESHTLVVTEDGRVFVCGDTRHGKLGLPGCGAAGDSRVVWRPTELRRFVNSGIRLYAAACGGCHSVLLGAPDPNGVRSELPMEDEQITPKEAARPVESAPKPHARRRTRDRNSEDAEDSSSSLPPLRRPNRELRAGDQENGEKVVQHWSDEEECAELKKPSFDRLLASDSRSKFDDMILLGDSDEEDERKAAPRPAQRSGRSLKSVTPSPRGSERGGSQDLLREDLEPPRGRTFDLRKDEEEEEELQPKARRRAKPGLFNRGAFEAEDEDKAPTENDSLPKEHEVTATDAPATEEMPKENLKEEHRTPIEETPPPNGEKVSVGCGGRKSNSGTAGDGTQKSRSCVLL